MIILDKTLQAEIDKSIAQKDVLLIEFLKYHYPEFYRTLLEEFNKCQSYLDEAYDRKRDDSMEDN